MQYTVAIDGVNVSVSQLNIITTVDRTLDYGSFLVRNKQEEAYDVGTIVDIDVTDGVDTFNYHFIIQADDVQTIKGGVYIHSIDIIELTKILEWQTESVRTFTQVIGGLTLSLLDVVIRLQTSIPMVKNEDVASTRIFAIDTDLANILREIEAPEFVFVNKNLKEILMEVFDFIGALPRLIKVSNDIVLTADFYNRRNNKITENEFSRMERFNINEFGTALDADLKNLFDAYTEVADPAPNAFKRLYAVGGDFSQENLIIKTDYPIVDIVSLKVKTDVLPLGISNVNNANFFVAEDVEIDLTPCILERALWENLTNAGFSSSFKRGRFRDNTLFFNRFSPDITNLYDVVGAFSNAPVVAGTERLDAVIERALELSDLTYTRNGVTQKLEFGAISNYAEIEFQIVYKAQIDSRTEVKRLDTRRIKFDSQAYTGQIDNVVRADRVLDKLFKTQQLLGNAEIMTSERTKELDDLFLLGDFTDDDYILTTSEFQFDKNYVTAKYMWTQNYHKVSEFIGLNSAIRLFPIPNDTYQRNVYLEDVIEIGTTLKSNDSDMTEDGLKTFMNTFSNSPSGAFNRPITNIAFENPIVTSFNPDDDIIVKPVSAYAGGNSINFHFEFDNPSIAGWQVGVTSETVTQNLNDDGEEEDTPWYSRENLSVAIRKAWQALLRSPRLPGVGIDPGTIARTVDNIIATNTTITTVFKKPIVNGIYYVDDNGFVGVYSFDLINGFTATNANELPVIPKTDLGTKLVSGDNYLVLKDAREELAMTYALHVVPEPNFEKTFIVGKYLVERNNLLKTISEAPNQFEVFTSTVPYDVHENQFSRDTDVVSAVTYSISGTQGNAVTLSQDITTAPVWGIRKIDTKELVIAVNQGEDVIRTIYFNVRDRKSGVVYPSQNVTIVPPVLRPASFQVIAPFPTSSVINLAWTDTNSPGADDFEFGVSTDLLNWTSEVVATNTKEVTGLESETVFTFRVRARIGQDFSEYVYVTSKTLPAPPPKPNGLTLTLLSERRILIQWDAVEDVLLYRIEVSENSGFSPLIAGGLKQAFNNFFVLDFLNTPSLDFDTQYFIRVRALKDGVFSDFADTANITTGESLLTSAPLLTNISVNGSNVTFTLVNTDNQLVTLFADFSNATTQRATEVRPNESRTFTVAFGGSDSKIFARAKAALKENSSIVAEQFAADEPPAAPFISTTDLVSQVGRNLVQWSYVGPVVDGFVIERNPNFLFQNIFGVISDTVPADSRIYIDTRGIDSQTTYTYRVKAVNRVGSETSNERSITTIAMIPAAPTSLSNRQVQIISGTEASAVLRWQRNSTDETGFIIEYRETGSMANFVELTGAAAGAQELYIVFTRTTSSTLSYLFRIRAVNQFGQSAPSNETLILI